jgi:hypothetical protein
MRVLLSSTDGAGHFGPLRPFIDALVARGDDVLIVIPPRLEPTVRAIGQPFLVSAEPPAERVAALWERVSAVSGREAARLGNRELFGRLWTAALLPAAERACRDWRPQLVLHEAAEYASAIAAERAGVAHAQVAISLAEVEAGSLDHAAPALAEHEDHIVGRLRRSPYLTRLPASLDPSPYPATERFREPPEPPRTPLAYRWGGSDAPLVYVTFGSVAGAFPQALPAYGLAMRAVAELPVRVLLTVGRELDLDALPAAPENVRVERWVPQQDVLGHAAVALVHGGSGSTLGALAAGVPLAVMPLFADQPQNARRVAEVGAGVAVEPNRDDLDATVSPLREAIRTVLDDPSYGERARALAEESRALSAVDEALPLFERFARS